MKSFSRSLLLRSCFQALTIILLLLLSKKHIFIINCIVYYFNFYISSIALVLHLLFILVSCHLTLLLPTLWHLTAYNVPLRNCSLTHLKMLEFSVVLSTLSLCHHRTNPEQIEVMDSESYSRPTCNKLCASSHNMLDCR